VSIGYEAHLRFADGRLEATAIDTLADSEAVTPSDSAPKPATTTVQ
jgi:hypothetical protein